jgi:hypothetical protein
MKTNKKKKGMTLRQIKNAIKKGKSVYWANDNYKVIDDDGEFLIEYQPDGHCIGLTWIDGKTMNGEEKDFYIK